MTSITVAYLLSFLFFFFKYLYIFCLVFHTGHREATKLRFRTYDSQKTVFYLRISEMGQRKTRSCRVSNIIINLDLDLLS